LQPVAGNNVVCCASDICCYGLKRDSKPTAFGMHKRSDAHNAPPGGFFVGENIYCDNGKWLIDQPFTKLHSSFLILIHEVIPSRPINNWDISVSEMCIYHPILAIRLNI